MLSKSVKLHRSVSAPIASNYTKNLLQNTKPVRSEMMASQVFERASIEQKKIMNTKVRCRDWCKLFSFGIGNIFFILAIILSFIYNGLHIYIYFLLGDWVSDDKNKQQESNIFYWYFGLTILSSLIMQLAYLIFTRLFWSSSKNLHEKMTWKVLRAPMRFHDTNSVGTILTKFSKDIQSLGKCFFKIS